MKQWLEDNYFIRKKSKSGKWCKYPNSEAGKSRQWWVKRDKEKFYEGLMAVGYNKMTDNVYYLINDLKEKPKCKKCGNILKRPQMEFCSSSCRSSIISNEKRNQISNSNIKTKSKSFKKRFNSVKWEEWNNIKLIKELYYEGKVYNISNYFDVSFVTAYNHVIKIGLSVDKRNSCHENSLSLFLDSLDIDYNKNDRTIINPKELDIFIPSYNIAIEINGLYWHSEISGNKNKFYHLEKTKECEEKGIQLFHVFSNEWVHPIKRKIWESVILDSLGIYECKIGARQTEIKEISAKEANLFCEENHLQGSSFSSINYGLFYKDELVSIMTFSKARFSNADWELQRFCSKKNYQVYGAASKLLKAFRMEYQGSIVSYANKRWSQGNLYEKLGFEFLHDSAPNYFYFLNKENCDYNKLESRNKYQKHKLKDIINTFDDSLSEWDNMKNNGFDRIWDSGNKVYIRNI